MTDEITEQRRVLWGVGSPRTMRPHWALHELSLPYQTEAIAARSGETQTATFAALNPRQKIPVLQDGDFTIAESPAIVNYLAEVYSRGDAQLLPTQQRKRAQWLEWGFFITMELDATTLYVVRRHSILKHIYGEAPAAVENARAYFYRQLGHVDQVLRVDGPFLMGGEFTAADILLTTCLTWAVTLGAPIYDSCRTYLERVTTRDAYSAASKANAHISSTLYPLGSRI
jgi:glutathione S-transferase